MDLSSPISRIRPTGTRAMAAVLLGLGLALLACSSDETGGATATDTASSTPVTTARSETAAEAVELGATWLAGRLSEGVLVNEQYESDDYSTTVEAVYALMAVGGRDETVAEMAAALEDGADAYASPGKEVYAGALGKLASLAADTGGDPHDFADEDLVAQLEQRTAADGRISDKSRYGDYANSLGQAWAVRALTIAGSDEATAARDHLLRQQCADGYLRQDFAADGDQPCGPKDEPSVDATALAVVLLHDLAEEDEELASAVEAATAWLLSQQADDGSFASGRLGPNVNSTGLAGWALQVAGEDDGAAAAAAWVRAHQVDGCAGALAEEDGAIAYDDAALDAAASKGITPRTSYQWQLATAQALPVLLSTPEGAEAARCGAR